MSVRQRLQELDPEDTTGILAYVQGLVTASEAGQEPAMAGPQQTPRVRMAEFLTVLRAYDEALQRESAQPKE